MNYIREGIESLFQSDGSYASGLTNKRDYLTGRVVFILLDDSDKDRFDKYGGFSGIGTVECERVENNNIYKGNVIVAKPSNSNIIRYPLVNEIVKLELLPDITNQSYENQYQSNYFYTDIVGSWDSIEHNILPIIDDVSKKGYKNNIDSYLTAESGIQNTDNSSNTSTIKSPTVVEYKERGDIRSLRPNPGDIIFQGRLGNSIRFSSSNEKKTGSPWTGKDGKPVLLMRNGQRSDISGSNFDPAFEDINNDGSSMYMLSGQSINFNYSSKNFETLGTEAPDVKNIVETNNTGNLPNQSLPSASLIPSNTSSYQSFPATGSMNDEINFLPDHEDNANFVKGYDSFNGFTDYVVYNSSADLIVVHGDPSDSTPFSTNVSYNNDIGNPYTSAASVLNPDKYLSAIFSHEAGQTGQRTSLKGSATGKYQIVEGTRKTIYNNVYKSKMTYAEFDNSYRTDPDFEYQIARVLAVDNIKSSKTAAVAIGKWYDPSTAIAQSWNSVPRPDYGNKRKMGDFVNFVAKRYK